MTQDGHHPHANGGGSNGHANGGTGSKGGGKESLIRDGLSPEEQAAVDKEMARHGPRVQAWPLHRSKVVYFVRHAEALHNEAFKVRGRAAYEDPCFVDPELTALGVQQCRALKPQAARVQGSLDLLVVSPLRRTLETALHTFDMLEGTPWVAHELVRERIGRNTCDRRRPLSVIKAEHPAVDFSHVRPCPSLLVGWFGGWVHGHLCADATDAVLTCRLCPLTQFRSSTRRTSSGRRTTARRRRRWRGAGWRSCSGSAAGARSAWPW